MTLRESRRSTTTIRVCIELFFACSPSFSCSFANAKSNHACDWVSKPARCADARHVIGRRTGGHRSSTKQVQQESMSSMPWPCMEGASVDVTMQTKLKSAMKQPILLAWLLPCFVNQGQAAQDSRNQQVQC